MPGFIEKLLENITSSYIPKLEQVSRLRAEELVTLRRKIRSSPEEVELWFDREIQKLRNIDVKSILEKQTNDAGSLNSFSGSYDV